MVVDTTTTNPAIFRIAPATRLGHVHLTVANLDRQIEFYEKVIGLQLHGREGRTARMGVGAHDLLRLTEQPGARRYRNTTGLYHFAILLPSRRELARAIARLFAIRWPNSPTDHVMTQTTYLDDPEGQNIELYADTPEAGEMGVDDKGEFFARRADGTPSSGRDPLDLESLFSTLTNDDPLDQPMPAGTTLGHVHLYVGSIPATRRFYHEQLGFDDMGYSSNFRMGMVSAGRYHHHIGYNTWIGEGAPPAPAGSQGLRYFTAVLPNAAEVERVVAHAHQSGLSSETTDDGVLLRDPAQNAIVLTA
jgi:catechol 2,3-dioxygenase